MYGGEIKCKQFKAKETPYGGRLSWILPGKSHLVAHLKDKTKIRHRKRWSQVRTAINMRVSMEFYILTGLRDFTETTSHAKENYVAYPFIHDQMYRWS